MKGREVKQTRINCQTVVKKVLIIKLSILKAAFYIPVKLKTFHWVVKSSKLTTSLYSSELISKIPPSITGRIQI